MEALSEAGAAGVVPGAGASSFALPHAESRAAPASAAIATQSARRREVPAAGRSSTSNPDVYIFNASSLGAGGASNALHRRGAAIRLHKSRWEFGAGRWRLPAGHIGGPPCAADAVPGQGPATRRRGERPYAECHVSSRLRRREYVARPGSRCVFRRPFGFLTTSASRDPSLFPFRLRIRPGYSSGVMHAAGAGRGARGRGRARATSPWVVTPGVA